MPPLLIALASLSAAEVLQGLSTTERGLSQAEVELRQSEYSEYGETASLTKSAETIAGARALTSFEASSCY